MRFATWPAIYLLALMPALVGLYAYAFHQERRALAAFVAKDLGPRLLPAPDRRRRWLRATCLVAAAAAFVIALMQPQWGERDQALPLEGRDVIVLLDVSNSMLAADVEPNRIEQAKAAVRALVAAVQRDGGHRLGLLTFAGRADVQCPLTRDYGLLLQRLAAATTEGVGRQGTAIGDALRRAVRGFGDLEPPYTDLVLVSDGEDHGSLPLEAAQMLKMLGIRLTTVGVGDPAQSATIPLAANEDSSDHLIHDGEEVRSRMRSGLLTALAEAAGGAYLGGEGGPPRLDRWYADHLAAQPRRALKAASARELAPQYRYFILLAIGLLMIEQVLRAGRGATA
jgi:Ca-activated chloride channel family protein